MDSKFSITGFDGKIKIYIYIYCTRIFKMTIFHGNQHMPNIHTKDKHNIRIQITYCMCSICITYTKITVHETYTCKEYV